MRWRHLPTWARDTVLRLLPHRAPTGLFPVGAPGPDAPVLLTGNFTLTVRRLRDALQGRDAWLLVADTKGINVWCAAGGGLLTHHQVIAVIRFSGLEDHVNHRQIVLPQLCATGVEPRRITDATGFTAQWGPARMEDLPGFLDRGQRVKPSERFMRFPLWERLEMALMWWLPLAVLVLAVVWPLSGGAVLGAAEVALACGIFGIFGLLPWLPMRGWRRWPVLAVAAVAIAVLGAAMLWLGGAATVAGVSVVTGVAVLGMLVLSVDLAGTTPWYGSSINTLGNSASIELVEERCTGAATCVQVCPRDVFVMDGRRGVVTLPRGEQCIECGACIVQCPEDALRFRYSDGRVVEAPTIRRTRMNMLGRRKIEVPE